MRDIKFRVWDNEINKFWHEGRNLVLVSLVSDNLVNDDSTVLEQYTGLHNDEGAELYEGDILLDPDTGYIVGSVEYREDGFWCGDDRLVDCIDCQVVGNIHTDKKLLEVKKR